MQLNLIFTNWTRIAGVLLIAGALAWAIKLGVIIATEGRIITTGAASFFMKAGLILLFVGSTGIGTYLGQHRRLLLRTIAILLSPIFVIGLSLLLATITSPLFKNSSVWYAQQEAPIGLVALVSLVIGAYLYRSTSQQNKNAI